MTAPILFCYRGIGKGSGFVIPGYLTTIILYMLLERMVSEGVNNARENQGIHPTTDRYRR